MDRMFFIVNPVAGSGKCNALFSECETILRERGIEYTVKKTEYKGHAVKIAEEAIKTAGAALPQGHFYVRCAIFPSKRSIKNAPRKRYFTSREGQDETAPQAPVAYPVGNLPDYPAAAVHLFGPPGPKQMGLGRLDHGRRHCKRPGGLRVQRGVLPALLQKDGRKGNKGRKAHRL